MNVGNLRVWRMVRWLGVVAAAATILAGCKEKDVPYVVDSEEIESYLKTEEDATDLFRTDGLVMNATYVLQADSSTYRDSVLSKTRSYDIHVSPNALDYGSYGMLYEALAAVIDEFNVKTVRTKGDSVSTYTRKRTFTRYGIFLKLGSDHDPYVGWTLWGFCGLRKRASNELPFEASVNIIVRDTMSSGATGLYTEVLKDTLLMSIGPQYIRLRDIKKLSAAEEVRLLVSTRYNPLVTAITDSGYVMNAIPWDTLERYETTLHMPQSYTRLYDIVVTQFLRDSAAIMQDAAFVPFKAKQ